MRVAGLGVADKEVQGTEPWQQITARLLSPEGLLVAVCYTPQFHNAEGG